MAQINVPVSDEIYQAAKTAAARAGMKFYAWVERAVRAAVDPRDLKPDQTKERRHEPVE